MKRSPLGRGGAGARAFVDRGRASSAQSLRSNKPSGETRACAICGKPFYARRTAIDRGQGRFCSRACYHAWLRLPEQRAALSTAGKQRPDLIDGARAGGANPNYRHGHRSGERDRAGERRWYASILRHCQHPGCRGHYGRISLHHIVYRQHLRKQDGDEWDPRNGITMCASCHLSHHHRGRVLPLTALRDDSLAYAFELLGDAAEGYLRRYYAGDDPRLGPEWRERLVRLYAGASS